MQLILKMKKIGQLFLLLMMFVRPCLAGTPTTTKHHASTFQEYSVINPVFNSDTYIFEIGQKHQPTVILIHGIGDEASTIWHSLAQDLSRDYHVVACDLPGFGRSEKDGSHYSPERYTAFIDWLISRHATGKVILAGHSLGGTLSLSYAAAHAEKVQQLLIIDAAGILHRIALAKKFLQINTNKPEQNLWARVASKLLSKPISVWNHFSGSTMEKLEFSGSEVALEMLMDHDKSRNIFLGGNPAGVAALSLIQEDFTAKIAAIKLPTSLIWGREDEVAPLRTAKLLHGKLANSRLRIIDRVGHVPILEQPEKFLKIFREELNNPPTKQTTQLTVEKSQGVAVCDRQQGAAFSGRYDAIKITGCPDVFLSNIQTEKLSIEQSTVTIENSQIKSDQTAITLKRAQLIATNLTIHADIAIQASNSRLDLAGVNILSQTAAIQSKDKTLALFSVSTISTPWGRTNQHGVVRVTPDKPL